MTTPDESETAAAKRWVETWKRVGPELERIRNQELRSMSEQEGLEMLGAFSQPSHRLSGLVDMQAWFMRWRIQLLEEKIERLDA